MGGCGKRRNVRRGKKAQNKTAEIPRVRRNHGIELQKYKYQELQLLISGSEEKYVFVSSRMLQSY